MLPEVKHTINKKLAKYAFRTYVVSKFNGTPSGIYVVIDAEHAHTTHHLLKRNISPESIYAINNCGRIASLIAKKYPSVNVMPMNAVDFYDHNRQKVSFVFHDGTATMRKTLPDMEILFKSRTLLNDSILAITTSTRPDSPAKRAAASGRLIKIANAHGYSLNKIVKKRYVSNTIAMILYVYIVTYMQ